MNIPDIIADEITIEKEHYREALAEGKPIVFHSCNDTFNEKSFYLQVLRFILEEIEAHHLLSYCSFLVNELVDNAIKANFKRVHFQEKGLNINDSESYRIGMEDFQTAYIQKFEEYCAKFDSFNFFTTLEYLVNTSMITIKVTNSGNINEFEYQRFSDRLKLANQIDSLWDALSYKDEFPEGVGLGIITIILMMKGLGVPVSALQITNDTEKNQTMVSVSFSTLSQFPESP